ncbi:MAG: alpha-L-fucosidase [Clostridia bacterium]|nr:alpha-L-fucosidase [Clostridia bacterium]
MHITDRFHAKKWGVFNHFLGYNVNNGEEWCQKVAGFDVELVAKTLHDMGAGYYVITLMQGRRYMLAPNATFDRIGGIQPGEACARRDLVMDLAEELQKYDIDLYLYYTGDGPYMDDQLKGEFGFENPRKNVPMAFVEKWAAVLEEYAVRYGDKVKGWWIDGCYDYFDYNDALLEPYYRAIKKGNPNAIVSFNNGESVREEVEMGICPRRVRPWSKWDDFTAGELVDCNYIPEGRFVDGTQAHLLIPVGLPIDVQNFGTSWCQKGLKRTPEYIKQFTRAANDRGVVISYDIWVGPHGEFDPVQVEALSQIGK